ncbi:hypothetical protein [Acinetobacter zhairhuonensis]|uniref:hypothetical protein n=1 Tax=Acinetobacter sp. A7.4 TaxID=2919921 RepID=UPI001F4F9F81|nr:hypothetical protein [Acinetobacter sp. A7.4]MCJ8162901.1 hypothetical protein [Acinetobacter sp. A7.4]
MKNIRPIKFSFAVSLVISFAFLLITFWIFYKFSWDANAAKDALSTTGSYYGAAATLGAAIIAAYLFNDWRDQSVGELKSQRCLEINNDLFQIDKLVSNADIFMQVLKDKNDDQLFSLLGENIATINNDLKTATTVFLNRIEKDKSYLFTSIESTYFDVLKGSIFDIQNILTCSPHLKDDFETFTRYSLRLKEYKERYNHSKEILDKYISYN